MEIFLFPNLNENLIYPRGKLPETNSIDKVLFSVHFPNLKVCNKFVANVVLTKDLF